MTCSRFVYGDSDTRYVYQSEQQQQLRFCVWLRRHRLVRAPSVHIQQTTNTRGDKMTLNYMNIKYACKFHSAMTVCWLAKWKCSFSCTCQFLSYRRVRPVSGDIVWFRRCVRVSSNQRDFHWTSNHIHRCTRLYWMMQPLAFFSVSYKIVSIKPIYIISVFFFVVVPI